MYDSRYDFRQRFGDDPGEDYLDADGGGLVRAIVEGSVCVLHTSRKEYADRSAEAGPVDVPAQIVRVERHYLFGD